MKPCGTFQSFSIIVAILTLQAYLRHPSIWLLECLGENEWKNHRGLPASCSCSGEKDEGIIELASSGPS